MDCEESTKTYTYFINHQLELDDTMEVLTVPYMHILVFFQFDGGCSLFPTYQRGRL